MSTTSQNTYDYHEALHEVRLLSARLKRTRADYTGTAFHLMELNNKALYPVFRQLGIAIQTLEAYEEALIDKTVQL